MSGYGTGDWQARPRLCNPSDYPESPFSIETCIHPANFLQLVSTWPSPILVLHCGPSFPQCVTPTPKPDTNDSQGQERQGESTWAQGFWQSLWLKGEAGPRELSPWLQTSQERSPWRPRIYPQLPGKFHSFCSRLLGTRGEAGENPVLITFQ